MRRAATCQVFWQSAGVVHLSQAPNVKCVVPTSTKHPPPQKKKPSWIALAYITQLHAHQSVRALFMFAPRCFSWRSRSKGEAAMERVRRSWANMRKHLHIWDAWQELSSRPTVNTHTRTQRRWSPCTCSTKAEELQPHCQTKCDNTTRIDWGALHRGASVRTCHWKMGWKQKNKGFLSHRFVLKHV